MSNFRFWATLITASVLGFLGFLLGGTLPLPDPYDIYSRLIYAALGGLMGLSMFAHFSAWIVGTTTRLIKELGLWITSEVINQFTQLASRGWRMTPTPEVENENGDVKRIGSSGAIILDTSSIIDGRVLDIARTGFLSGLILVPEFVLTELRTVADSADPIKRARGRNGFDVVEKLKKTPGVKIEIWDKELVGKAVDDKLLRLGRILHGRVLTCDYNLNRMAKVIGVKVLNVNDLTNSLKTLPIPGEKLSVKITQQGKDDHQGVGYCPDGTMVVVKDASTFVGQEISVDVTKIIQGPAGRIIFAKPSNI